MVAVKDMLAEPAAMAVTTPVLSTVAMEVLLLLQTPVPKLPASERVVTDPAQMVVEPLMVPASGNGLTVIAIEVLTEPQLLVAV